MEGNKAFQRYLALKLHFTTDYDFFRYSGKVRSTNESFEKRKDSFFFRRLERKYSDNELTNFFVSNFVSNNKIKWIGELSSIDSEKTYVAWKKKMQSFSYVFKQDLLKIKDKMDMANPTLLWEPNRGEHPEVLRMYLGKKISIETLIASNIVLNFLPRWDREIKDTIVWPDVSKYMRKYQPFMNVNKEDLLKILRDVFVDK